MINRHMNNVPNIFSFNDRLVKKMSYRKRGGIIKVKIVDEFDNVIHKAEAHFNDKKEMSKLWGELKIKGVKLEYDDSWL